MPQNPGMLGSIEFVIEARNACDVDLGIVEDLLTTRDRPAMFTHHVALMIVMTPFVGGVDTPEDIVVVAH